MNIWIGCKFRDAEQNILHVNLLHVVVISCLCVLRGQGEVTIAMAH